MGWTFQPQGQHCPPELWSPVLGVTPPGQDCLLTLFQGHFPLLPTCQVHRGPSDHAGRGALPEPAEQRAAALGNGPVAPASGGCHPGPGPPLLFHSAPVSQPAPKLRGRGSRPGSPGGVKGRALGGGAAGRTQHSRCPPPRRSPASATASSRRRASGLSIRRRGARLCSRSQSSSRWTSPTRRAGRHRRRTAFTPSRSRSCQVSHGPRAWAPGYGPVLGMTPCLPQAPAAASRGSWRPFRPSY